VTSIYRINESGDHDLKNWHSDERRTGFKEEELKGAAVEAE
jgi:hypothetical protein